MSSGASSILLRRRHSEPRRRTGASLKLGAVKMGAGGAVCSSSDCGGSDAVSSPTQSVASSTGIQTPQDHSPLLPRTASHNTPAAASEQVVPHPRKQKQQEQDFATQATGSMHPCLGSAHSADAWLESQMTQPSTAGPGHQEQQEHARRPPAVRNVESAASQIVHKAMQYLTVNEPTARSRAATKSTPLKFDLLDKGMDAITGVGKIMEGFAMTLDSVIGQAFEEWSSSSITRHEHECKAGHEGQTVSSPVSPGRFAMQTAPAAAAAWAEGFGAADEAPGTSSKGQENIPPQQGRTGNGRQMHVTSFMSKINAASETEVQEWRRRAQQLAKELQKIQEQQEEYQRIKEAFDKLKAEQQAKQTVDSTPVTTAATPSAWLALAGPVADPALHDPLAAQQVTCQMEVLLAEKAKLAQDNARLLRENTGLQELLEFTMLQQADCVGDDELFGDDEYAMPVLGAVPEEPEEHEAGMSVHLPALAQPSLPIPV